MRVVLVTLVLVLGVVWAAEDEANDVRTLEQEDLLDHMEDGQGRIDLGQLLGDLVAGDAGEDTEPDKEEVDDWDGRARTWKINLPFMKKTKIRSRDDISETEKKLNAQDQRQYNNLVDTLLRRINADARKLDPMMINIMPEKKKSGTNKKYRYPKYLNTDEAEDSSEDEDTDAVDSEHHIQQREIYEEEEDIEEELVEEGRRLYPGDKEENVVNIQSKRIKLPNKKRNNKKSGNHKSKKRRNKNKNKMKTGNKKNKKSSKNSKNNKDNNKNKKRAGNRRPKSVPSIRTSRAEVTGFATLRRDGDIKIITGSNGITEVKTNLVSGPINLKVTRKFGAGKDAITRIGNAASPQMKGNMVITVDAPGKKQKITKFQILRPSIVTTHGSLAKEPSKRRDNNFLENTLPRASPVVTKKLMLVAKEILNAN